jgi:ubiquinone/menaquinone biosynthesis C-methylase UbiE
MEPDVDLKESVQRQFGAVAASYSTSAVHTGGPDLTALIAAAALRGTERVLDAGCGTGHTALALAPNAATVVGVDLTPAMLAEGTRMAGERGLTNVQFVRGDVERLEFPAASFDLVTSRYSAHHYPRPLAALREFARVLRPGGRLLLPERH